MSPQIYDMPELHRQMLHVLGIKNIEKLVPTADDLKPTDPVQENQNVLAGKPVKAVAYQDHESHITVHSMAMQDPIIQQLIGQNPQAQTIQAAMMAHIAEHVGFAYRNKMSEALGAPLPDSKEGLPPEMEYQLSKLLAQAAAQVIAQSKAMVANQQAQQNQQDPLMQMQQQELQIKQSEVQIKQSEVQRKAAKDQADNMAKQEELKLQGLKVGVDIAKAKEQSGHQGSQRALDFNKHREQLAHQKKMAETKNTPPERA
jgi:hypothetical protein